MDLEYKADTKRNSDGFEPIVNEYRYGIFSNSFRIADAPVFDDVLSAFEYARKEAAKMNRRISYEQK
jgi:hypothetical protein